MAAITGDNQPERWALLIGIDFYIPGNKSTVKESFRHLKGCVNNVNLVASFLKSRMKLSSNHIVKLTSTNQPNNSTQSLPPEDPASWPTRDNIINAFENLAKKPAGSLVYIHHSGHGAQVPTTFPKFKGKDALDEALVPADFQSNGGRYIRDLEMASWLENLVEAGLHVTLVLDSCHASSRSANRQAHYDGIRGLGTIEWSPVPAYMDNALPESLVPGSGLRKGQLRNNWFLEASKYVLIAACASDEKANEGELTDAGTTHGALTYHLIKALENWQEPDLYCQSLSVLLMVIRAKVRKDFSQQRPSIDGSVPFNFFGLGSGDQRALYQDDMRVIELDDRDRILHLHQGNYHRVEVEDRYEVFSNMFPRETAKAIATIEVIAVRDLHCRASLIPEHKQRFLLLSIGFRAKRISEKPRRSAATVAFHSRDKKGASDTEDIWMKEFRLHSAKHKPQYWNLSPSPEDGKQPCFYLFRTEQGEFEIQDGSTNPIPNVRRVGGNDVNWTEKIARYLDHLARFQFVKGLGTQTTSRELQKHCTFRLFGKSDQEPPELAIPQEQCRSLQHGLTNTDDAYSQIEPIEPINEVYSVRDGEWVLFCFNNTGPDSVYFTVIGFSSKWGISKVYPTKESGSEEVQKQTSRHFTMVMETNEPKGPEVDTFRAIVTKEETSFDCLLLDNIDEGGSGSGSGDQTYRGAELKGPPGEGWQVYDVTIRTS